MEANVPQFSREGKHMLRKQILLSGNKEYFCLKSNVAFETYVSQFSHHETMLTRFQCCSLKCFQNIAKMVFMLPFAMQFKYFFNVFANRM